MSLVFKVQVAQDLLQILHQFLQVRTLLNQRTIVKGTVLVKPT